MKKLLLILSLISAGAYAAGTIKLSELPLGSASTTGSIDSFPYTNATLGETMKLRLSDLINIPTTAALFDTKASTASPVFTGHGSITGDSDNVPWKIKGYATQTNDLIDVLKSDNTNLFKVTNAGDGTFAGSVTASSFIGPSTGNLTLATPHNHGVLLSGTANATTAITPSSSTAFPLVSGGASADPLWALLGVVGGGTGAATFATNGMLYGNAASAIGATAAGSQYQVFQAGASGVPTVGALNLAQAAAVTGILPNASTTAASANTASAIVARDGSGNFSAGTITASVTGHSSLDLAIANNLSDVATPATAFNNISGMSALGDLIYGGASGVRSRLAGNTTTTEQVLSQTGTGSGSAAPVWLSDSSSNVVSTLVKRDGSGNFSAGTITATVTGTSSGNPTLTPTNHGVVISGATSGGAMTASSAGTQYQPFVSNGASSDGTYQALSLAQSAAVTGVLPNANTTAASANTASAIVARDGSGNFTAGTVTATQFAGGLNPSFTAGSVPYMGGSSILAQDNANFFWDGTNHRLGLGSMTSPTDTLQLGTGNIIIPAASSIRSFDSGATKVSILTYNTASTNNLTLTNPSSVGTGNVNIGTTSASNTAGDINFLTENANRMTINQDGVVGIGTTAPVGLTHISGAPTATANYGLLNLGSGPFDGTTSGKFVGSSSGTVEAINTASGYAGNLVDYQVNGASKFHIEGGGNVGIGTTTAGSALDIKGTLRLSGASSGYVGLQGASAAGSTTYTLPSADAVGSGYALTSNAAGTLSWSAVATVSNQTANTFNAGPTSGSAATPTYRALTSSDITAEILGYMGGTGFSITSSNSASALTITLKQPDGSTALSADHPGVIAMPTVSSGFATGKYTLVPMTSAVTLVIPSGATLGCGSVGTNCHVYVYLVNNSGTAELAVSTLFQPSNRAVTTTAIDTASDTDGTFSTTARTNVPFRMIGRLDYATNPNGAWSNNPDSTVLGTEQVLKIIDESLNGSQDTAFSAGTAANLNYLAGANVPLMPGYWNLFCEGQTDGSGAATTQGLYSGMYGANGANSSSVPAALSTVVTVVRGRTTSNKEATVNAASVDRLFHNSAAPVLVHATASTNVYCICQGVFTTAGGDGCTATVLAERLF